MPEEPHFTHRNLGMDYPVIYAGHGDLVDDGHGNWYVVMLASRPCRKHSSMGRETFLAKVIWENGWPVIAPGVGHLEEQVEIPMEEYRFAQEVTKCDQIHFWDKELDQRLIGIGGCDETIYSLKEKRECCGCIPEKKVLQKQPIAPILDYGRKAIALKRKQEFSLCRKTRRKRQVWFFTRIMRII